MVKADATYHNRLRAVFIAATGQTAGSDAAGSLRRINAGALLVA